MSKTTIPTGGLADSSVTTAKITDATIASGDLADDAVTAAKIADAVGLGKIGQVVSTTVTAVDVSTTASTFNDISGLSAAITPSATSSKILIIVNAGLGNGTQTSNNYVRIARAVGGSNTYIGRGGSLNSNETGSMFWRVDQGGQDDYNIHQETVNFLDTPSTTSEITYKMQWGTNSGTLYLNRAGDLAGSGAYEHIPCSSTITVMEVLA
tara:strand:+ start:8 stop:637 length:630 start_codon:yes stop_codon:yes gene_type:complete